MHSTSRNRRTHKRAEKLVWVFSNLRLAKTIIAVDYKQAVVPWEVVEEEEEEEEEGQMGGEGEGEGSEMMEESEPNLE